MTPAVGFLTRALRGVKGQAKKLSLFDPDPQLMTMATLTDNASLVVGDGDRIIAKNTQWLTDVPEATDEEGSNEADDASPITSPLDPAASLHQSVGSIAPGPGSQRGLGVGGVVGTTTLSGPSPLRGSGVVPEPVHERHEDTQHGEHACHLQEVAFSDEQEEQQRVQARREVLSAVRSVLDRSLTAPTAVMLGARPKEGGGYQGGGHALHGAQCDGGRIQHDGGGVAYAEVGETLEELRKEALCNEYDYFPRIWDGWW